MMGKVIKTALGTSWWAENGLIKYTTVDGDYDAMTPTTLETRLVAMQETTTKQVSVGVLTFEEAVIQRRWIQDLGDLIREARIQGSPDDESAVRDRIRRAPVSISMSNIN